MSESAESAQDPRDVRPVIATGSPGNWGLWAFLGLLAIGGLVLFNALNASREAAQAHSVLVPSDQADGRIASPAPLRVPDRFAGRGPLEPAAPIEPATPAQAARFPEFIPPPAPRQIAPLPPQPLPEPPRAIPPPTPPRVVFDNATSAASILAESAAPAGAERVAAGRLRNPSRTIPQGTVIPAVLETALDSTRAGGARALVQRDVSGFDGTRVLIPRGSRLYGEYEAELRRGQNRALVRWTRLIRPDGVTIALDSPSSDPLGRAGIRGKVDTKFLQRFGGAILQSVLDIGVGLAVNEASNGVIVALPGSTQNVQVTDQQSVQPTLKVKHGTSVSVFVARDLDFSTVEQ
ncbi:TrbI/VirB10 family protein [Erythrobacter sp. JK5]|uniref:TrbI/VirB10 family protein n=1 Tax=Erythrobacter sp. JK5 TaxID=2829500 RepID=UPI001BACE2F4|nr:TrbI/VirB10 family protein [Erythrobacter sp. JK5]QUL36888.1 TrbI/VirB10 family protein [Erythrobacter sp. JK5]